MNTESKWEKLRESIYFWTKVKFGVISVVFGAGFYFGEKYLPDNISLYSTFLLGIGSMLLLGVAHQQFQIGMNKIKSDEAWEKEKQQ